MRAVFSKSLQQRVLLCLLVVISVNSWAMPWGIFKRISQDKKNASHSHAQIQSSSKQRKPSWTTAKVQQAINKMPAGRNKKTLLSTGKKKVSGSLVYTKKNGKVKVKKK